MNAVIWIILAAILGVAEIFTLTAALGLLAVAALAAAAGAALGLGGLAQFVTFAVGGVAGLVGIRPLVSRQLRPRYGPQHRFGVAALVGRQARGGQEVTGPARQGGGVREAPAQAGGGRIGGEEWSARAYDESLVIPAGVTVDVIEIEGATA